MITADLLAGVRVLDLQTVHTGTVPYSGQPAHDLRPDRRGGAG